MSRAQKKCSRPPHTLPRISRPPYMHAQENCSRPPHYWISRPPVMRAQEKCSRPPYTLSRISRPPYMHILEICLRPPTYMYFTASHYACSRKLYAVSPHFTKSRTASLNAYNRKFVAASHLHGFHGLPLCMVTFIISYWDQVHLHDLAQVE